MKAAVDSWAFHERQSKQTKNKIERKEQITRRTNEKEKVSSTISCAWVRYMCEAPAMCHIAAHRIFRDTEPTAARAMLQHNGPICSGVIWLPGYTDTRFGAGNFTVWIDNFQLAGHG